jgi:hypothetical protein
MITYQLVGLASILGATTVQKRYAGGKDVALVASNLINDALNNPSNPVWPDLGVQTTAIGIQSSGADFLGAELSSAINGLVDQSANSAVWGADVRDDGSDLIFFEPVSPLTARNHTLPLPVSNISEAGCDIGFEDVVNRVQIESDQSPLFPNLIYNGGFERPILSGSSGGNILRNGDFEQGTLHWNFSGGASIWPGGQRLGATFSGDKMAVIDSGTERATYNDTPAVALIPGHTYRFSFRAKRQKSFVTPPIYAANYTLGFLDNTATLVGDFAAAQLQSSTGTVFNSTLWTRFEWQGVCPPTGENLYVDFSGDTGLSGPLDGILFDAVEVLDVSSVFQDGWEVIPHGTAQVEALDWACEDSYEGGYCTAITATAGDSDANDIYIAQKGGARFSVTPGMVVTFAVRMKTDVGATSPKMKLNLQTFYADQAPISGIVTTVISAGALTGEWSLHTLTFSLPVYVAYGFCWISIRGSGRAFFDNLRVSDNEYAAGAGGIGAFVPDGNYVSPVFSAEELFGASGAGGDNTDPSDAYYDVFNSVNVYGVRQKRVQVSGINNSSTAEAYAIEYLKQNATPLPAPTLTISDSSTIYRPGETCVLTGKNGRLLTSRPLTIARVSFSWSAGSGWTDTLQLSRELRDRASLIQKMIDEATARQGGTGSTSPGQASPVSAAGGSWSSTTYWGESARTPSDSTFHDDYLPADGPHVLVAERDAWNDVSAEVITARGGESTLNDRLASIGSSARSAWKKSLVIPDLSSYTAFNIGWNYYRAIPGAVFIQGTREAGMSNRGWNINLSPWADFDYTVCFDTSRQYKDYHSAGIGVRNNSTSASTYIAITDNGTTAGFAIEVVKMSDATTISSTPASITSHNPAGEVWLRIRRSGGEIYYSTSASGNLYDWTLVYQEAATAWTSASYDKMGIFTSARSLTIPKFILTSLSLEPVYDAVTAVGGGWTDANFPIEVQPCVLGNASGAIPTHTWTARQTGTFRVWVELAQNNNLSTYKLKVGGVSVGNLIDGVGAGTPGWNIVDTGVDVTTTSGSSFSLDFNIITANSFYLIKRVYLL